MMGHILWQIYAGRTARDIFDNQVSKIATLTASQYGKERSRREKACTQAGSVRTPKV